MWGKKTYPKYPSRKKRISKKSQALFFVWVQALSVQIGQNLAPSLPEYFGSLDFRNRRRKTDHPRCKTSLSNLGTNYFLRVRLIIAKCNDIGPTSSSVSKILFS